MISYLRPFYTKCYMHIPEEKRAAGSKLDAHALEGHCEAGASFRGF